MSENDFPDRTSYDKYYWRLSHDLDAGFDACVFQGAFKRLKNFGNIFSFPVTF